MTQDPSSLERSRIQRVSRADLEQHQLCRLNQLLERVLPVNKYYQEKLGRSDWQLQSLEEWQAVPLSTKSDWLSTQESGIARHHSYPRESYKRYHRTSGTRGRPMVVLDTAEDWTWWTSTWQYVLDASGIHSSDRILMAFSFGPFIGFWSAHDACLQRGCMVIPSGGMSTIARIDLIESSEPTVLFATPSYALHLGHSALQRGIDLSTSSIQTVFVAGEPGGSISAVRKQIEQLYGARVMDHAGATEIGPWGVGSSDGSGLRIIESEFIAEFLPLEQSSNLAPTPLHDDPTLDTSRWRELVLTSLGRVGAPVLRYRTGDIVCPDWEQNDESVFVHLKGGVLGRADDMFVVRGVNVFPSSIEEVIRRFSQVKEFRILIDKRGNLDEVRVQVDMPDDQVGHLQESLLVQLGLRIPVETVLPGSLESFEGKSKRVIRMAPTP